MKKWKPKVVLIVSKWSNFNSIEKTRELIEFIGGLGSNILLIEQPPELYFGDKNTPQYLSYLGIKPYEEQTIQYIDRLNTKKYKNGQLIVQTLSKQYTFCDYISIEKIFGKENKVAVLEGANVLYIDDDHLSYMGSLKIKNKVTEYLKNAFDKNLNKGNNLNE